MHAVWVPDGEVALIPQFSAIPAGEFEYGDRFGDGGGDERPAQTRGMPAFGLAKTPVMAAQYLHYLRQAGLADRPMPLLHCFPADSGDGLRTEGGKVTCPPGAGEYPVVFVSWLGANAYCEWLSGVVGAKVRLPTEAEWQYAAGGAEQSKWSLGNTFDRTEYASNADGPSPVWQRKPSGFGLHDMTGNVFEWCLDTYHYPPGATEPATRLPDSRLIKGGAFILRDPMNYRNAKRFSCYEASCVECVGFRPLCEGTGDGRAND